MEHQIDLGRPANQIQSRYQSPRFGPYLIHNTICRWKGDEPSESRYVVLPSLWSACKYLTSVQRNLLE